jgi:hypothetical protein
MRQGGGASGWDSGLLGAEEGRVYPRTKYYKPEPWVYSFSRCA